MENRSHTTRSRKLAEEILAASELMGLTVSTDRVQALKYINGKINDEQCKVHPEGDLEWEDILS